MQTINKETRKTEKQKIAKEMAVYFCNHFTEKEVIVWQMQANEALLDYYASGNHEINTEATAFLSFFSNGLIQGLLDAETPIEKVTASEEHMINIFSMLRQKSLKECLREIGMAYLSNYSRLNSGDTCGDFMAQLSKFMNLSEMYGDYEFHHNEEVKEMMAA